VATEAEGLEGTLSLGRGLRLLLAIAEAEVRGDGAGVIRLAEIVGIEKSRASRMLGQLNALGLIERDPASREFHLGSRMLALAARAGEPRLLDEARPLLRRLVADYGESAFLHVLTADAALTLRAEPSPAALHVVLAPGQLLPLWRAAGRALLLDHDHETLVALAERLGLDATGGGTPPSAAELIERVEQARESDVVSSDGELDEEIVEVAAPVRVGGRIVAAVSVCGPAFRFREPSRDAASAVLGAAHELAASTARPTL
jgi:IclR family transcriptional regulator, KDG regulon repressor